VSRARPVYPGSNLMLTRRVRGRTFLLRPDKRTTQLVGYVLAVISAKWRIRIIAAVTLSNHWHVVLADDHGTIVEFQRDCHSFIARGLNACHGEFEAVWSSSAPSLVACEQPEDVIQKVAYTMANPVAAGLVMHGSSWPGLRMAWPARPKTFARPAYFFAGAEAGGAWPESATLELHRPPGHDELADDELAAVVDGAIRRREDSIREEFLREGRRFLGRRDVLRQSRHARPRTREPRGGNSPRVACTDKWRRIERLRSNRAWPEA